MNLRRDQVNLCCEPTYETQQKPQIHTFSLPLQLPLPLDNIPHQLQPLNRKLHHIRFPITPQPRLHLPRHRPLLARYSERHIPRRPIPRRSTSRPRRPALTNRICAPQRLPSVFCEAGDNVGGGPFVVFEEGLGPARVCDARLKGVEGEAAFVVAGRAGEGEEGCGDQTACSLGLC